MLIEFGGASPFAVLAFRGTEQKPQDVVTDLEVGIHTLGKNKVGAHEGFSEALDSVWLKIEKELDALKCPVIGHSLGAALTTLAAGQISSKKTRLVWAQQPMVRAVLAIIGGGSGLPLLERFF